MTILCYDPRGLGIIETFASCYIPGTLVPGTPVSLLESDDEWDDTLPTYITRIRKHGLLEQE